MEMLLKEHLGRCVEGGRKGAAPGSPRAVSAGSGLVLCPERQGAQGGPVSGSDSCLGSSLWGLGAEVGSRGAETDMKTEERHRSGGNQDCILHMRSGGSPLDSREGRPAAGWGVKEERTGRCVDSLGRGPGVVTAGQSRGAEEGGLMAGNTQKQGLDLVKNHT